MELEEAFDKVDQILDEERSSPTVDYLPAEVFDKYDDPKLELLASVAGAVSEISARTRLQNHRKERPRRILEGTREYRFRSSNHDLLCALLSRLEELARPAFVQYVLGRIHTPPACAPTHATGHSVWQGLTSELPLVVEFAVRNGGKDNFLRLLAELDPIPAHVLLLHQVEEMISLDFRLFTADEYTRLALAVSLLVQSAERRLKHEPPQSAVIRRPPSAAALNQEPAMKEIIAVSRGIKEQCRKARFFYVKGELKEGLNLEVNQDKQAVESYLRGFGFSDPLVAALNEAERLYQGGTTAFDLKSCIGHLRSFLEKLHEEAMSSIVAKHGGVMPDRWGNRLSYLRERGVLTKAEEGCASALYTLMSDEAVHPLIAEREYARLARNMVIEYGLLFLRKLDKLGLLPKKS